MVPRQRYLTVATLEECSGDSDRASVYERDRWSSKQRLKGNLEAYIEPTVSLPKRCTLAIFYWILTKASIEDAVSIFCRLLTWDAIEFMVSFKEALNMQYNAENGHNRMCVIRNNASIISDYDRLIAQMLQTINDRLIGKQWTIVVLLRIRIRIVYWRYVQGQSFIITTSICTRSAEIFTINVL